MTKLIRLWRGEIPLPDAFWNWAVFGGLLINGATTALFFVLIMQGQTVAAWLVGFGIAIPYNILATVGVWRAADRYTGDRRWADLAKGATVVGMLLLSLS
jgi:hypothetical protein